MLIKLETIDLRQPLQPIHVDARYAALCVWVCWGYVPLGMLRLPCESDTCTVSSERLRRAILHAFGWQLWEGARSQEDNPLTRGRGLDLSLDGLA